MEKVQRKKSIMNDWLKDNGWGILIALVGVSSTFILYGFRLEALEKEVMEQRVDIVRIDTQQNLINVQLAEIAKDIQYIKVNIEEINQ
jgi:hypothetical protein